MCQDERLQTRTGGRLSNEYYFTVEFRVRFEWENHLNDSKMYLMDHVHYMQWSWFRVALKDYFFNVSAIISMSCGLHH